MSDTRQNLITDGVDVAIRLGVGPLDDSTFGAGRLGIVERLVVAAPDYLSSRSVPANPAELVQHDCIVQHGLFGRESWRFTHNHTVTSVDVPAKLWINSAPGVLAAAVAGLGIALATRVMAGEELRSGQLVELLNPYRLDPAEIYAIYPAGPRPSAKVRAIVDHLEHRSMHRVDANRFGRAAEQHERWYIGDIDRPTRHFGTHRARFDHDHVDAQRGDFSPQRVTDRFERELRACIRTVAGHGDLAAHGAHVDREWCITKRRLQASRVRTGRSSARTQGLAPPRPPAPPG